MKTVPVPLGMRRFAGKLLKSAIYQGSSCRKCGRTARYSSNRGCVWCIQERVYNRREISKTVPFEQYMAALRSNSHAQSFYQEQFDEIYENELKMFVRLTGIEPKTNKFYFSMKECQHEHPRFRSVDTGKCLACEVLNGRFVATRKRGSGKVDATERAAAIRAYWLRTDIRAGSSTPIPDGLPKHLTVGVRCDAGHPGVRYKANSACWFCANGRTKKSSKSQLTDALIWAALVA